MAVFKCKMCGASLTISAGQSIVTCDYCDTQQTIPKLTNDRIATLYDRANHFRRNNDFDKAMGIYESILNEDNTDAEAYWSLVLCRYGIEYVEDPKTKKRIPTVNRAQFTSIFDDQNYKSALTHADNQQRKLYEAEAHAINEIQKGILAISQNEDPFDVFICYKESDPQGNRTLDSVLATELYQELTREGFKVFFARITLEDKLGVAYEPYIFAALQSAKVMVVLGTRPEHFNAVWVKNEWSRYLALIKQGQKKVLIPAYRDMDPYDLPEEFAHLQAQDMAKLGYLQDLTRGIGKIVDAAKPKTMKETVITASGASTVEPLLKRAFMFLEDGEFNRADEFCEQVLNQDPENAMAYLGKLMAELKIRRKQSLGLANRSFHTNKNYEKAIRFGDSRLVTELKGYSTAVLNRISQKQEEDRIRNEENRQRQQEAARIAEEAYRQAQEKRIADEEKMRKQQRAKAKRTKAISITVIVLCLALGLSAVFGVYPILSVNSGNYKAYINLYRVKEYTVPEGVTEIQEKAFYECKSLTSITIPDGVTEIGDNAFTFCENLTSVSIPDSVTRIGYGTFSYCNNLREITLPEGIVTLDVHAFSHCTNLSSINLPNSLTEIGDYAFYNDSSLESITIPKSVTYIGEKAFVNCTILYSIHYEGTMDEWNSIDKEDNWYSSAYAYTIHCTDGDITE